MDPCTGRGELGYGPTEYVATAHPPWRAKSGARGGCTARRLSIAHARDKAAHCSGLFRTKPTPCLRIGPHHGKSCQWCAASEVRLGSWLGPWLGPWLGLRRLGRRVSTQSLGIRTWSTAQDWPGRCLLHVHTSAHTMVRAVRGAAANAAAGQQLGLRRLGPRRLGPRASTQSLAIRTRSTAHRRTRPLCCVW